ncbi:G-protein coupled receptor 143-like [Ctenocephalides felis]|uniref:G-protein coupled receptor 143-like n=1 Tax=Ctenocephalides felis TaxID=7515 RepID=UPI000E6E3A2E|nr:G-protein coupled receptor 143-like [Ctenocephalides felis]
MSLLTIQPVLLNSTDDYLLKKFNETQLSFEYNLVCLSCASLGIVGAIYQILPRNYTQFRRFQLCRSRQIIIWLAVADLMAALGIFARSIVYLLLSKQINNLDNNYYSILFSTVSSIWVQYFYTSTWFWTLVYALDVRRSLRSQPPAVFLSHVFCWLLPAVLTCSSMLTPHYTNYDYTVRNATTFLATYFPIMLIMLLNPLLYYLSSKEVFILLVLTNGQVTNKERHASNSVSLKFLIMIMSFYVCWTPNIFNGFLIWLGDYMELPYLIYLIIWYMMAVTNPLQAAINAVVYKQRSAEASLSFPCCASKADEAVEEDESTPLLGTASSREVPYWSVNHSCSYL